MNRILLIGMLFFVVQSNLIAVERALASQDPNKWTFVNEIGDLGKSVYYDASSDVEDDERIEAANKIKQCWKRKREKEAAAQLERSNILMEHSGDSSLLEDPVAHQSRLAIRQPKDLTTVLRQRRISRGPADSEERASETQDQGEQDQEGVPQLRRNNSSASALCILGLGYLKEAVTKMTSEFAAGVCTEAHSLWEGAKDIGRDIKQSFDEEL